MPLVFGEVGDEGLCGLVVLVLGGLVVADAQLGHEVEGLVEVLLPQHLEPDEVVVVLALDRALEHEHEKELACFGGAATVCSMEIFLKLVDIFMTKLLTAKLDGII